MQNRGEELLRRPALGFNQPLLTAAYVHQQAQRQRQIRLAGEILDFLLLAVFEQREVLLLQVPHQPAVLVADRAEDVDQVDVDLDDGVLILRRDGGGGEQKKREHAHTHSYIL